MTINVHIAIIYVLIGVLAGVARVSLNFYNLTPKEWLFVAVRYAWLGMFWAISMYFIFDSLSRDVLPDHYRYFIVVFGAVTAMEILGKFEELSTALVVAVTEFFIKRFGKNIDDDDLM